MKRYRVSFVLELEDDSSHPRKWVPEAIVDNLNQGEDVLEWEWVEVTAEKENG